MTNGWLRFSPHAWGWSEIFKEERRLSLVLPTRVGMVRRSVGAGAATGGSPHTRGDGPQLDVCHSLLMTFSPHAWGWSEFQHRPSIFLDVLPTRVGMVRSFRHP